MKNELISRMEETRKMHYEIGNEEAEVNYLREETQRMAKKICKMQEDKRNYLAAIVLFKKQNDSLKEKVIIADNKCKDFISDVSILIKKNKK